MFIECREDPISTTSAGKHKAELTKARASSQLTLAQIFLPFEIFQSVAFTAFALRVFQSRNYHKMKHLKRCTHLIFLESVDSALEWNIQWTLSDLGREQTFPSWSSGYSGGLVISLILSYAVAGLMLTCSQGLIQHFLQLQVFRRNLKFRVIHPINITADAYKT